MSAEGKFAVRGGGEATFADTKRKQSKGAKAPFILFPYTCLINRYRTLLLLHMVNFVSAQGNIIYLPLPSLGTSATEIRDGSKVWG